MSLLLSTGAFASSLSGAAPGMVLMKPTSISNSSGTATLGTNGQITFSSIESVSLNGVFTADFDNYTVAICITSYSSNNDYIQARLRVSATDATGSNYARQTLFAQSSTVSAARQTSQSSAWLGRMDNELVDGHTVNVYGPALAQPTAFRASGVIGEQSANLSNEASTHSLSTAYDGFTIYANSGQTFSGKLAVYGIRS